jgi:hypothetical protein
MAIDMVLAAGIIGAVFLIIAWIWETKENVQRKKVDLHMHFSVLYIIGNSLLVLYSWWIQNIVFFALGLFLLIAIVCETLYATKVGGLGKI